MVRALGLECRDLGFGVGFQGVRFWDFLQCLGFRFFRLSLRVRVLGFGLGFGVQGSGIWPRVWCLGFLDLA